MGSLITFLIGAVVIKGVANYLILKKFQQSNAWIGFIPFISQYKMGQFAYETVLKGKPNNKLYRGLMGFTLFLIVTVSPVFLMMQDVISTDRSTVVLGINQTVPVHEQLQILADLEMYGVAGVLLVSLIATFVIHFGIIRATMFNGVQVSLIKSTILSIVSIVFPTTGVIIQLFIGLSVKCQPAYDYTEDEPEFVGYVHD